MAKTRNRVLAWVLSLAMALTLLPTSAWAEDGPGGLEKLDAGEVYDLLWDQPGTEYDADFDCFVVTLANLFALVFPVDESGEETQQIEELAVVDETGETLEEVTREEVVEEEVAEAELELVVTTFGFYEKNAFYAAIYAALEALSARENVEETEEIETEETEEPVEDETPETEEPTKDEATETENPAEQINPVESETEEPAAPEDEDIDGNDDTSVLPTEPVAGEPEVKTMSLSETFEDALDLPENLPEGFAEFVTASVPQLTLYGGSWSQTPKESGFTPQNLYVYIWVVGNTNGMGGTNGDNWYTIGEVKDVSLPIDIEDAYQNCRKQNSGQAYENAVNSLNTIKFFTVNGKQIHQGISLDVLKNDVDWDLGEDSSGRYYGLVVSDGGAEGYNNPAEKNGTAGDTLDTDVYKRTWHLNGYLNVKYKWIVETYVVDGNGNRQKYGESEFWVYNEAGTFPLDTFKQNIPGYTYSKYTTQTVNQSFEEEYGSLDMTTSNSDTTVRLLYALDEYTVTYDLDGGESEENLIYTGRHYGDETPKIQDPTKTGYEFKGWSPSVAEKVTGNVTYKAQWEPVNYSVTYTWEGAPTGETCPTGATNLHMSDLYSVDTNYTSGKVIETKDTYGNVTDRYTFSGWASATDAGGNPVTITNGTLTMPASNVTISGTWSHETVTVLPHKVSYSWSMAAGSTVDLPSGIKLPGEITGLVKNQPYSIDTSYYKNYTIETKDAYDNTIGRYTFSGWTDPNGGTMGDADVVVTGTWSYEAITVGKHTVTYQWENAPADEVLPLERNTYVLGAPYTVESNYTSETTRDRKDAFGNINGKYTFSGWTSATDADGNSVVITNGTLTMPASNVTIKGTWKVEDIPVPTYNVTYDWGTPDAAVTAVYTLPVDSNDYVPNQPYNVDNAAYNAVVIYDAYNNPTDRYTFSGWSLSGQQTMGNADVTITGTWNHEVITVGQHTVSYTWTNAPAGVTLPATQSYVPGQTYEVDSTYTDETVVNVYDEETGALTGTYTFNGWNLSGQQVMGNDNVVISGTWTYTAAETPDPEEPDDPDTDDPGTTRPTRPITPSRPGDGDDDTTDIMDEEVPLAELPGLNTVDHFAYITGYDDGTVRPEGYISRAEVATIFFRLMTDEYRETYWSTSNLFTDVAVGSWYNNAISTTGEVGWINGYPDDTYRPNNYITRAEFATIAARFLSEEYDGENMFTDIDGHWAAEYINRAARAGWITGYAGEFRPNDYITRAEAVTLINRMLDRAPDADHMLEDMVRWPDNPETAWYYEAIQEATNSHDYDRETIIDFETWTELLPNRDWAALEEVWAQAGDAPGGEVID